MKSFRKLLLSAALVAFAPSPLFACAACGSANGNVEHSAMIDGMNLGILTLLGVIVTVLAAFLTFLIHIIRKSEAMTAAAEKISNSTDV